MGVYTFKEFRQELKFELGERTDLSSHSDLGDLYGKWVNKAYLTLTTTDRIPGVRGHFYFPELHDEDTSQSTSDGTKTLDVPSGTLYVEGVWDTTNDVEMENISWPEYKEYVGRSDSDARGKPTEWVRRTTYLYLHLTPDDVYACTIYFRKKPSLLTGVAVTVIGSEWDEVILKLSVVQSLMRLKRYEEAAIEQKGLTTMLYGLVGMYDKEKRDRTNQIRIHARDRNYGF